jgi:opacity protein-like surface antigen
VLQVLLGVAHVGGDNGLAFSDSNNTFAMAIGGGVDFKVSHDFSIAPLQADYLMTRFNELGFSFRPSFDFGCPVRQKGLMRQASFEKLNFIAQIIATCKSR